METRSALDHRVKRGTDLLGVLSRLERRSWIFNHRSCARCYTGPDLIYTHESRHYVARSLEHAQIISQINSLTRLSACNNPSTMFGCADRDQDFSISFLPSFLSSGNDYAPRNIPRNRFLFVNQSRINFINFAALDARALFFIKWSVKFYNFSPF